MPLSIIILLIVVAIVCGWGIYVVFFAEEEQPDNPSVQIPQPPRVDNKIDYKETNSYNEYIRRYGYSRGKNMKGYHTTKSNSSNDDYARNNNSDIIDYVGMFPDGLFTLTSNSSGTFDNSNSSNDDFAGFGGGSFGGGGASGDWGSSSSDSSDYSSGGYDSSSNDS